MNAEIKKYGSTKQEASAEEMHECRQIVREIVTFGIKQHQILKLIGLLAMELENRDHLQQISSLIKRLEEGDFKKSTLITEV